MLNLPFYLGISSLYSHRELSILNLGHGGFWWLDHGLSLTSSFSNLEF